MQKNHTLSLPNILTYGRIIAVPLVVLCFFVEGQLESSDFARWTALGLFIVASITDFFDGYLARIWKQTSTIGLACWTRLPTSCSYPPSCCFWQLMARSPAGRLWAAIIILCREILVSGLREYLAELKVSVPVSRLAKWKTTAQMVALAFLLAGPAGDKVVPYVTEMGIVLLWISALLTLYTGWDYFKAGLKHVMD